MTDETTTCVALLHDVVEDTAVTIEDLEKEFPKEITDAVRLLTHDSAVRYEDYIRAIQSNPIAKTVKLADLTHNQDESRITDPHTVSAEKLEHWRRKYKKARELLEEPQNLPPESSHRCRSKGKDAGNCTIRKAVSCDLPAILEIYQTARKFMAETGNASQWGDSYPPVNLLEDDLAKGELYVITDADIIHGVFVFLEGEEPNYTVIESGSWLCDTPYRAIHRVASDGTRKGIVSVCMNYCKAQCSHLRIDTHENNHVMQHVLEKNGFQKCGIIHLANGSSRIAYEYIDR
jgi:RimJ/RimL family protein N-acetyltransferase